MLPAASAVLYALFLWWFSTGLILYGVGAGVPQRWTALLGAGAGVAGLVLLALTAGEASVSGAYLAFTGAVLVWGAVEVGFLTGLVLGPRRTPCPEGATGWRRARFATEAILHHELALVAAGLAIAAATWNGNPLGLQTFAVLWAMRLSSKLNLFLGVPVTNEDMLPRHLRYLASYFSRQPINLLFPVSVTLGTAATALLGVAAADAAAPAGTAGLVLLATFLALAVLEHWFMVLPLPSAALWRWSRQPRAADPVAPDLLCLIRPDQAPTLQRRRS